tara:strand:+ start:1776 stop:2873 length:1098 start_codon:yes stop_codon:yes gene_type:complete
MKIFFLENSRMKMKKPRLLIIPNDDLKAYDDKGHSREERNSYFNPNNEFDVSILGVKDKSKRKFNYAGFEVYPINRDLKGLWKVLDNINPDLVRGYNGGWASELSGRIGNKLGIPSFTSVHDMDATLSINDVDRVFCVSETVKNKCLDIGGKEEKLKILYNGLDLNVFKDYRKSDEVEELNIKYPGKHKILSVGRLVWQKNLENLIKASKIVNDELANVTHIHIGKFGELKDKIISLSKKFDLNHFYLLPNTSQKKIAHFYSWADIFTMASVSEGFGVVYIEALACSTPIVTSDIPPMNKIVINNYNGLTANPNSPKNIAKKVMTLLTNKNKYKIIKSNTIKSIEKFEIKKLKKQEARLYKELLK